MSCYMLTDAHHASVAAYVGEKLNFSPEKIQTLANTLKRINRASVNYRYNERKPARFCKLARIAPLDESRFYDAIRCWHYQSCDNPHNLDFDVMCGFLFSLVPASFNTDMKISEWGIA